MDPPVGSDYAAFAWGVSIAFPSAPPLLADSPATTLCAVAAASLTLLITYPVGVCDQEKGEMEGLWYTLARFSEAEPAKVG